MNFDNFLLMSFFGNAMADILIAVGIFVGVFIVLEIFQRILLVRLRKFAERTAMKIDDLIIDVLQGVSRLFYSAIAFAIAIRFLVIPPRVLIVINAIVLIILVYEVIKALERIISYLVTTYMQKAKEGEGEKEDRMSTALSMIVRLVLWAVGLLLILSNLGINVNSLVASLGIAGIAVSLALQSVLGDLFSSFAIAFDKPFEEGDFIVVGEDKGTVKHIGLKTTRIQALQGEEIVISNAELTSTRVQNFKKMQKRRVSFSFGVVYATPHQKLQGIPQIVSDIIDSCQKADFDRAHFHTLGDSALIYDVVYYMNSSDYVEYMDTQQHINLSLLARFAEEGVEMAYPTQTLYVKQT